MPVLPAAAGLSAWGQLTSNYVFCVGFWGWFIAQFLKVGARGGGGLQAGRRTQIKAMHAAWRGACSAHTGGSSMAGGAPQAQAPSASPGKAGSAAARSSVQARPAHLAAAAAATACRFSPSGTRRGCGTSAPLSTLAACPPPTPPSARCGWLGRTAWGGSARQPAGQHAGGSAWASGGQHWVGMPAEGRRAAAIGPHARLALVRRLDHLMPRV